MEVMDVSAEKLCRFCEKEPAALYIPKGAYLNTEDLFICENCRHLLWTLLCDMLPEALRELVQKAEEPPREYLKVLEAAKHG